MRRALLIPFTMIPIAALVVVLPLVVHGCSCGHDFDFHLISWMEAAAQFRSGVWHPSWAFSPAWNAGEPRFVFYPPISWTLGALLGLALPWGAVPIVFTWLSSLAAGFAMYWMARELEGSQTNSAIAAIVYMANPYMIFTAYERTAYAELLAAAWIPLMLAGILGERLKSSATGDSSGVAVADQCTGGGDGVLCARSPCDGAVGLDVAEFNCTRACGYGGSGCGRRGAWPGPRIVLRSACSV